ncbi:uncharacterized protein [Zea mays]|uniref:uncharacterized protein isoform X2 n=1 Tax=Zea mays TaxID=4577 RepID=UPI00165276B3|nr:uncharacterized protein LOC103653930 isoform X2 [Zea mays]
MMNCGASCSTTGGERTLQRSTRRRAPSLGRTSSPCRTGATDTDCKPPLAHLLQLHCFRLPSAAGVTAVDQQGVRIIREGKDYYLIYQGEIQRYLGSRQDTDGDCGEDAPRRDAGDEHRQISDRILFFLGDLEKACADAKRVKA